MNKKILKIGVFAFAIMLTSCENDNSTEVQEPSIEDLTTLEELAGDNSTKFSSKEDWEAAVETSYEEFSENKELRKDLELIDEAQENKVGKFERYLLHKYGNVVVAGDKVLTAEKLANSVRTPNKTRSTNSSNPRSYVWQNQRSYKVQAWSFKDNHYAYSQIGGKTQFKKKRRNWGFTKWWDTDASKLSIKCVYFDNPAREFGYPYNIMSFAMGRDHDKETNDDYISERAISIGLKLTVRLNFNDYPEVGMLEHDGLNPRPGTYVPKNYNGVWSFHYVKHSAYTWKLETSTGLRSEVAWGKYSSRHYIPWN